MCKGIGECRAITLTDKLDNLTGTSGNDTFLADDATSSAADQINGGAGTDTFKTYGTDITKLATLKSIEVLEFAGQVASGDFDLSAQALAATGVAKVVFDDASKLNTKTITTTAGQSLSLATGAADGDAAGKITWAASATDTALNLTLNGFQGKGTAAADVTVTGALATTLNIASTGAANKVATFTGPTTVTKHVITGDQNLTYALAAADAAKVTTIDASAATGKVAVDVSAGTQAASFAFTGGSGNDTLTISEAGLNALAAGSQLNGGAGTDTLKITSAVGAYTAADYKAINAATGFEVLGLGTATGDTVDASQLTSIKEFSVGAGTNTITKIASGSTLDITAAGTDVVSGAVGVTDLVVNIGTATTTAKIANTALDVTGLTNVTVNANIKAGVVGEQHALGTLKNSDNSTFTIKGNGDLKLTLASETTTGSKVDGSASTGKLELSAGGAAFAAAKTSLGDILIGGAGDDTLVAGKNSTTLTGNAGKDLFDVSGSVIAATSGNINETTVTDFTKGDSLKFGSDFKTTSVVTKVDLSGLAAGKTDLDVVNALIAKTATAGDLVWGTYNGNTYVVEDAGTKGTLDTGYDIVVKLTGTLDLSTSTHAADQVLVFA